MLVVDELAAYEQHAAKAAELLAKSRVRVGTGGIIGADERDRLAAAAAVNAQLAIAAAVAQLAKKFTELLCLVTEASRGHV